MEHIDDPIGALNDYLCATLSNEHRAKAIIEQIASALNIPVWNDERLYEVAQCLAIAQWPEERKVPAVLFGEFQRHNLRDTIELLKMAASNIVAERIQGYTDLTDAIETLRVACNRVLDQAKNSAGKEA